MKHLVMATVLIASAAVSAEAQWQGAALRFGSQLATEGLKTCLEVLVKNGINACFDQKGKANITEIDRRLREVETLIGACAKPLRTVHGQIDSDTTPAQYIEQLKTAFTIIDKELQQKPVERDAFSARITTYNGSGSKAVNSKVNIIDRSTIQHSTINQSINK